LLQLSLVIQSSDDCDVVAGDASYVSSSSLLLLLSAVSHDASVWAPMVWNGSLPPLSYLDIHALIRLSLSILHFFFGRRI